MPNDEFRPPAQPDAPERRPDSAPDPIANTQAFRAFAGGDAEPARAPVEHRNMMLVVVPVLIVVVIAIVVITLLVS